MMTQYALDQLAEDVDASQTGAIAVVVWRNRRDTLCTARLEVNREDALRIQLGSPAHVSGPVVEMAATDGA